MTVHDCYTMIKCRQQNMIFSYIVSGIGRSFLPCTRCGARRFYGSRIYFIPVCANRLRLLGCKKPKQGDILGFHAQLQEIFSGGFNIHCTAHICVRVFANGTTDDFSVDFPCFLVLSYEMSVSCTTCEQIDTLHLFCSSICSISSLGPHTSMIHKFFTLIVNRIPFSFSFQTM